MSDLVKSFNYILKNYVDTYEKTVDKTQKYYKVLTDDIPNQLYRWFDEDKYLITGSAGRGNRTRFPWVCIYNKNITTSAQHGIYIGYLFRKDMTGFYLTLTQGVKYFRDNYKLNQYQVMAYSREVILDMLNTDEFSHRQIDLRANNTSSDKQGYGYERSTIISKLYKVSDFSEKDLEADLLKMKELYQDLFLQFQDEGYDHFIQKIVEEKWLPTYEGDFLDREMHKEMLKESELDKASISEISVQLVNPNDYEKPENTKKTTGIIRKTDYVKKAKRDTANGYLGEKTVFEYEKQRLSELGRSDLAKKVKILSTTSDSHGYDIISYDVNDNGIEIPRYIEVKSTTSEEDAVVYFSENEINVSKKYDKQYWVYRVIDVKGQPKKMYMKQGSIEDNYDIYPTNYKGYRKF